jgi:hypothetical protein
MDRLKIYTLLGVQPLGLLTKDIQITLWGTQLALDCLYDPENPKPFQLIFKDCHHIRWELTNIDVDERDVLADVVAILLGEDGHRQPAVITTDIFEISVLYGKVIVNRSW